MENELLCPTKKNLDRFHPNIIEKCFHEGKVNS